MRILALVPGGIGDQILFFPTLETLKKQYPQAAIDVLVEPRALAAYRVCKYVNEVLLFDYRDRSSLADYLNLLGVIRDREYEASISLGTPWTVELIIWLNGIPKRIGYRDNSSLFLSNPVALKSEQYLPQMYHDLVTGLGIKQPCPPVTINVPTQDIDWAEAEQKRLGIKDSGYVLLYDRADNNTYPISQWQKIIGDIQQKQSELPLVLLQTADNQAWVTEIMSRNNRLMAIALSDIGKLAAIIAGANLMLCTNSTLMQLAIAVGTYTIALLGSSDSYKFLPPDKHSCVAIPSTTDKIADIKPEKVLEQIWRG